MNAMKTLFLGGAAVSLVASSASDPEITCGNDAAEISCDNGVCEINTDSFTPMGISIAGERSELCAYSACYKGRVVTEYRVAEHSFFDLELRQFDPLQEVVVGEPVRVGVIHRPDSRSALVSFTGFAQVMSCDAPGDTDPREG
ncbi:hypothetical protein [uncultured Erythrobacter sp.]|uniref:hypothetical protein n=1 Tax=uncultured Erythrobacter sp. TaxID=263913 RepID=UPI00262B6C3F|nr:hypothetical protein [uncultured Erythrobacter sp.]